MLNKLSLSIQLNLSDKDNFIDFYLETENNKLNWRSTMYFILTRFDLVFLIYILALGYKRNFTDKLSVIFFIIILQIMILYN